MSKWDDWFPNFAVESSLPLPVKPSVCLKDHTGVFL